MPAEAGAALSGFMKKQPDFQDCFGTLFVFGTEARSACLCGGLATLR